MKQLAVLFLGLLISACNSDAKRPAKIGYVSYASGSADVYLMNADGSNIEQITNTDDNNSFPFQIDKETIGFSRFDEDRNQTLHQINIYTKEEQLYEETTIVDGAKWQEESPDGHYVAYVRSTDYRDRDLYIYNTKTKSEKLILSHKDSTAMAYSINHSWSSDSKKLVFMSGVDWYNQVIRYYDVDNDSIVTVTDRGYMNSGLLWTGDDKTLVANLKVRDETLYELYSVNSESGVVTRLTDSINLHPNIASDGKTLVFESQRHGDGDIYTMKADGTELRRITTDSIYEGRAFWFEMDE